MDESCTRFVFFAWICRTFSLLTFAIALCAQIRAQAPEPGGFDLSFGTNGKNIAISIGGSDEFASAAALQRDGKILIAGTCNNGTNDDFCVIRLLPNGQPDPSFKGPDATGTGVNAANVSGRFVIPVTGAGNDAASSMLIQSDGKIVVGGTCTFVGSLFCIVRLNEDGSFDQTFDGPGSGGVGVGAGNGKILFSPLSAAISLSELGAMALQLDGKIVAVGGCDDAVAGGTNGVNFCIARLNVNGSFDLSFDGPAGGADGRFFFSISNRTVQRASSVAIDTSGRILVSGDVGGLQGGFARFTSTGAYDTSFDGPGATPGAVGTGNGKFEVLNNEQTRFPIGMPTSGKFVGVGSRAVPGFSFVSAIRLNENGSYDTKFATDGVFFAGSTVIALTKHSAAMTPDGKVLIGVARNSNLSSMRLVRLTALGEVDPTFTGIASTVHYLGPVTTGADKDGVDAAVMIQPFDNKIVTVGTCNMNTSAAPVWKFCAARYHGGPSIDGCSMDIDGDGAVTATTDSLIHARIALGISGSSVVSGINFPPTATRTTWPDIRDYLGSQCGMSLAP
jgi:uncharacterized delta-60 repeat protein